MSPWRMHSDNLSGGMDPGIRSSRADYPTLDRTKLPRRIFQHSLYCGNINLILKAVKVSAVIGDYAIDIHKRISQLALSQKDSEIKPTSVTV